MHSILSTQNKQKECIFLKKRADGRWVKKVKLQDGTFKYFYSSAKSEREAVKDFNNQLQQVNSQQNDKRLFTYVSEEWSREHFPTLQHNTLKQYKPALKQVNDYFYDYNIDEISPSNVNAFLHSLIKKQYAYKTVKARLLVLNLVIKYAIMNQYIEINPCQYITVPKNLTKTKRQAATIADTSKIINNTDKPFGLFTYFLLLTGCRRGEALALSPKDIDFKNKTVTINKTVEWVGSKPNIKNSPKTDAGNREIPLSDNLIKMLLPLKKQKYLFANDNGELMNNSQVTRAWNNYIKEIDIKITPHQLRHSYATILFDAGIDIKTAQKWLGHADIKTTLEIYTHLSEMRIQNSKDKLLAYVNDNYI